MQDNMETPTPPNKENRLIHLLKSTAIYVLYIARHPLKELTFILRELSNKKPGKRDLPPHRRSIDW